jgi:UDP-glucose 4-epimerase
VLDPPELARLLGARPLRLPRRLLRGGAALTYGLHLQPSEPGWVDMAFAVPLMDSARAREELGWKPARTSGEALLELIDGMREGAGLETPPLEPGSAGPLRAREFLSGVGGRL